MKKLTLIACYATVLASCSSSTTPPEVQKTLTGYRNFVDSVYSLNESWKMYPDTDFVETPIDPADPSKTRIDTIVTTPEFKKSILKSPPFGAAIMQAHAPLKAEMEKLIPEMNENMKKEYETSRQKFESLMVE